MIAIVAGVLVVLAVAVVGVMAATGNLPFGSSSSGAGGSSSGGSAGGSEAEALTDFCTVEFYEQSFGEIRTALDDQGFELAYIDLNSDGQVLVSFESLDEGGQLADSATGNIAINMLVEDDEWDSDEVPESADEISDDAELTYFYVTAEVEIGEGEYVDTLTAAADKFSLDRANFVSATDLEVAQELLDAFGVSDVTAEDAY